MLISTYQLTHSFGPRPLFRDLSLTIEPGERIGLIGPNGAGKSTLLHLLAGHFAPSQGEISMQQGLRLGYLDQVPQFAESATLLQTIQAARPDLEDWESEALARQFISRLGLQAFEDTMPVAKLSGGWKKRLALAKELIKNPDLLLLDEPTNHLDIEGIAWLETFLAKQSFAILTITHDRLFLQRVANRIIELDPRHAGGLLSVQGDYLKYLAVREQLLLAQEQREVVLKNTLRRETAWLQRGARARSTKQQARIQQAGRLAEAVSELEERNEKKTVRLDFVGAEKNPQKLIEAKGVSHAYGTQVTFSGLNLTLTPGSRLGLLGRNGAGKTTLIRTLLGSEPVQTGTLFRSEHLAVAYFDQNRQALDPSLTLSETLCDKGDHVTYNGQQLHIRGYLNRFLFTSAQMNLKVGHLSGGEQSRLLIARLMLKPANLLVLDEPTNDLDIATLNVLEECLQEFRGAMILVTHDRYFLDHVATQLLAFPPPAHSDKQLQSFATLEQWQDWQESLTVPVKSQKATRTAPPTVKKARLSFKEQRELDGMAAAIEATENRLAELNAACSQPQSSHQRFLELSHELATTQEQLDQLYQRWAELEAMR